MHSLAKRLLPKMAATGVDDRTVVDDLYKYEELSYVCDDVERKIIYDYSHSVMSLLLNMQDSSVPVKRYDIQDYDTLIRIYEQHKDEYDLAYPGFPEKYMYDAYPAMMFERGPNKIQPLIEDWLHITPEKSAELGRSADYKDGHFIFLTGKISGYIAIYLDKKDISITGHAGKVDGVTYWKKNYSEYDTLIIETPTYGLYLVYEYQEGIKSGHLNEGVLIDVLSDGKGMVFGPGYRIVNSMEPALPPRKLVQQILFGLLP